MAVVVADPGAEMRAWFRKNTLSANTTTNGLTNRPKYSADPVSRCRKPSALRQRITDRPCRVRSPAAHAGTSASGVQPDRSQSQGIADDGYRAEAHRGGSNHRA